MNELNNWFQQKLIKNNLTRRTVVESMGYENVNKGIRQLDSFLNDPDSVSRDFYLGLCEFIDADKEVFDRLIELRRQAIKPDYKPHLKLIFPHLNTINPLMARGCLSRMLTVPLPNYVLTLDTDEKEQYLARVYQEKLKSLDSKLAKQITGYELINAYYL